jgi:hypothetical protein
MEIMSDKSIWVADRPDTVETTSTPKLGIVKQILSFFSFSQEDRLKAGVLVRSEKEGDENTVSSYFLRTPPDRINPDY